MATRPDECKKCTFPTILFHDGIIVGNVNEALQSIIEKFWRNYPVISLQLDCTEWEGPSPSGSTDPNNIALPMEKRIKNGLSKEYQVLKKNTMWKEKNLRVTDVFASHINPQ